MVLQVTVPPDLMGGGVDEGYGKVADAFRANLASGNEVGAAVAVYRDGVKVVDLWGGYRDGLTKDPWRADTMVNMFSSTKGVSALVMAAAVSRGLLSYDARVADYWPEFAQAGKGEVTVRQLLDHQAGLPVVWPLPGLRDVADPDRLAPMLAAQAPAWSPGTRHGYHAIALGWYQSELLRRVTGRTVGRYLAEEIAGPLGVDLHIGLPKTVGRDRVATLHHWKRSETVRHLNEMPLGFLMLALSPFGLTARSTAAPRDVDVFTGGYNRDDVRAVEIPSANGIGTARAVAQLYGDAATGGAALGLTDDTVEALCAPAVEPSGSVRDKVLNIDTAFSLGLSKPWEKFVFGSSGRAVGTPGCGGSFGFADPDTGVGFSYVMNRIGFHLLSDPRELALRQALFRDVLGVRPQR